MNNYLLLTNNQTEIESYLKTFIQSQQISPNQIFRFRFVSPMAVEEFRQLLQLTQIRFHQPSLFVLESFDNYSEIVQNTFLKTLEEHQPTVFFVLTAQNLGNVLPTIVSRCTVKILATQLQSLSSTENKELELMIKQIQTSGLASSVIKLGLKDKKQKALVWLENFLKFGYQQLPITKKPKWLSHSLRKAIINYTLIKNSNLDPETALDQVFLS